MVLWYIIYVRTAEICSCKEEHPELFVKEEPVEEPLVPEDDVDVYEDFESYDDYSDFYTEEELEKMNKEKLQREKNNKKKKK